MECKALFTASRQLNQRVSKLFVPFNRVNHSSIVCYSSKVFLLSVCNKQRFHKSEAWYPVGLYFVITSTECVYRHFTDISTEDSKAAGIVYFFVYLTMPQICVDYMESNSRMNICRPNEFGNLRKEDIVAYFKLIFWHFHENFLRTSG
jgi:hypothetical protein